MINKYAINTQKKQKKRPMSEHLVNVELRKKGILLWTLMLIRGPISFKTEMGILR
jgi:hypothetical protein